MTGPYPHDLLVAFFRAHAALEKQGVTFFRSFGLTDAQFNILNLLARDGGEADQLDVIEHLLVGKATVSTVLNRLVRDGLVVRSEHARDRRKTVLRLTRKGRELWRKVSPAYEKRVNAIFGAVPGAKRSSLVECLETLRKASIGRDR